MLPLTRTQIPLLEHFITYDCLNNRLLLLVSLFKKCALNKDLPLGESHFHLGKEHFKAIPFFLQLQ